MKTATDLSDNPHISPADNPALNSRTDRILDDGSADLSLDLSGVAELHFDNPQIIHSLTLHNCHQLQQLDLSALDGPRFLYLHDAEQLQQLYLTCCDQVRWLDQTQIHLFAHRRDPKLALRIEGAVGHIDADLAGLRFDSTGFTAPVVKGALASTGPVWSGVDLCPVSPALNRSQPVGCDGRLLVLTGQPDEPHRLQLDCRAQNLLLCGSRHLEQLTLQHLPQVQLQLVACPGLKQLQLQAETAAAKTPVARLISRQSKALELIGHGGAEFISLSDISSPQLSVQGPVTSLMLTQVKTGHLNAPKLQHLELNNSGRIGRLSLPIAFTVKINGAKPAALDVKGELCINESSLRQLAEQFAQDKAAALESFRELVPFSRDKKTALVLLRSLNAFYQQGLSIDEAWALRSELNAAHNDLLKPGHKSRQRAWQWQLPADLLVEGWSIDFKLWLQACLELPEACAYADNISHTLKLTEIGYKPSREVRRLVVKHLLALLKKLPPADNGQSRLPAPYQQVLQAALASPAWLESADLDLVLRYLAEPIASGGDQLYQTYMEALVKRLMVLVSKTDTDRVEVLLAVLKQALHPAYYRCLTELPVKILTGLNQCAAPGWDEYTQRKLARLADTVRAFALTELHLAIQALAQEQQDRASAQSMSAMLQQIQADAARESAGPGLSADKIPEPYLSHPRPSPGPMLSPEAAVKLLKPATAEDKK